MSGAAQYEERGGLLQRARQPTDTMMANSNVNGEAPSRHTSSSALSITEHDFRFPRRPASSFSDDAFPSTASPSTVNSSVTPQPGTHNNSLSSVSDLDNLDFSATSSARKDLLRESFFPTWKDDAVDSSLDSPDEMQRKDPLATQIWRLYSKTKKQLPNADRMENLTWRLMAMNLRKARQQDAEARYANRDIESQVYNLISHTRQAKQQSQSAPSGIAQLRKTSDQGIKEQQQDTSMNIDDFIFADSISTPAGLGTSPSPELMMKDEKTSNAVASAIPIKMRKESAQFAVPQSVPAPHHNPRGNEEFNYVQRHVRKTSIDERRVS